MTLNNLLIGTLITSAICVYIVILRRMKSKQEQSDTSENKIPKRKSRRGRATFERARVKEDATKENLKTEQSEGPESKCSFYVGYLGTLAKGSIPPKECSTCPDGAICTIVPKEQKRTRAKKAKKAKKDQVKRTQHPTRKKTKKGRTKRGRTKKKTRVKSPP